MVCYRISTVCGRGGILCVLCFSMHSVPSFPVFMRRHPLIASCTSAEHTCYCGAGSTSKRCVQCNFSAEPVRHEATEWSDKGSWLLVSVWAVCGGLKPVSTSDLRCQRFLVFNKFTFQICSMLGINVWVHLLTTIIVTVHIVY